MSPVLCKLCNAARIVTVTESFVVFGRTVFVTLCMRCWLEGRKSR